MPALYTPWNLLMTDSALTSLVSHRIWMIVFSAEWIYAKYKCLRLLNDKVWPPLLAKRSRGRRARDPTFLFCVSVESAATCDLSPDVRTCLEPVNLFLHKIVHAEGIKRKRKSHQGIRFKATLFDFNAS